MFECNVGLIYPIEPLGLENVAVDFVDLPPSASASPVDTPCSAQIAMHLVMVDNLWNTYDPRPGTAFLVQLVAPEKLEIKPN